MHRSSIVFARRLASDLIEPLGDYRSESIEIWFQDEARIGQKDKITRRWARRGTRPSAPHDERTRSTYIFGAICPARGTGAGLGCRQSRPNSIRSKTSGSSSAATGSPIASSAPTRTSSTTAAMPGTSSSTSPLDHHVDRTARLGTSVLISGIWCKPRAIKRISRWTF
jgi:hypothetical protein